MTEGPGWLGSAEVAERIGRQRHFVGSLARQGLLEGAKKLPSGEWRIPEEAVAAWLLANPPPHSDSSRGLRRIGLWATRWRVQHRVTFWAGVLSGLGGLVAVGSLTGLSGIGGRADESGSLPTASPTTAPIGPASPETVTTSDLPSPAEAAQLIVEWPLLTGDCLGNPIAMNSRNVDVEDFSQMLSITEDPRSTAVRLGGYAIGGGQIVAQIRNNSDEPLYVDALRMPSIVTESASLLDWEVDVGEGCGGGATGQTRTLVYNLEEQTLLEVPGTLEDSESGAPPKLYGTRIEPGDSLSLVIDVVPPCRGTHEFAVVLDLSNSSGEATVSLTSPQSFKVTMPTEDLTQYIVRGARGPTGRVVELASPGALKERASSC